MTDIPVPVTPVPGRLGVTARYEHGELILDLDPQPQTQHHGITRASVLSYLVDAVSGIQIDQDPDVWTLTTDMTVRMRPVPAAGRVTAVNRILRHQRRSATCLVELTTDAGDAIATGAIGFVHTTRKGTDPPKPSITPEHVVDLFRSFALLAAPLREEAGIEVVDAGAGVVRVELVPELLNPAGTLQGAMVALVAEAAAEDLLSTRYGCPVVVTDLDLRYLARTHAGPVTTRTRLLGAGPEAPVQVELIDSSTGALTTLVYARATQITT